MTMILPNKIEILGIPYVVEEVEVVDKDVPSWGQIDHEKLTIRIEKSLAPEKKGQVFIHEVVHGILANIGQEKWNEDENAVQGLAAALYSILSSQTISFS